MSFLLNWLERAFAWLLDMLKNAAEWLWHELLGALGTLLSAIPVPAWLSNAPNVVGSIPPGVAYLAQSCALPQGLAIVLGAYTIRFIIRRIPLIG